MESLDKLRVDRGYTQAQMAKKLKISTPTYCQYENGQRLIPGNIADAISCILMVSREEIFLPAKFTICEKIKEVI